jgi:hypothetical protein
MIVLLLLIVAVGFYHHHFQHLFPLLSRMSSTYPFRNYVGKEREDSFSLSVTVSGNRMMVAL